MLGAAISSLLGENDAWRQYQSGLQQQADQQTATIANQEQQKAYNLKMLYGYSILRPDYAGMRNAYKAPPVFPRSEASKVERMDKFVKWKREKITERRVRHLLIGTAIFFGTPLLIALASVVWKVALASVL